MTNSGLRQIDYASGRANRIDVAARRAVMTGVSQLSGKISEMNAEKLGTEHFEVEWHAGARPTHAVWQGRVYSKGVLKKLGYWLMIMVAFGASAIFIEIGKAIGVDLGITTLLGWFVLASLLINEIRSILENFVEAGFNVPIILIKGLEVADKVVNKDGDSEGE